MVVNNQPAVAAFHVSKAVAGREVFGLSVLHVRKRVIASIDRRAVVYADQLIAECDLEAGQNLEGGHEIIPQGGPIRADSRRQRPPEYGVLRIERQYLVGIVLAKSPSPRQGRLGHLLFRFDESVGGK